MAAFQIPRTPHTTNKTIRFPDDVIADVEAAIAGKDCTFSAFVIAAVRSALAQLAESPRRERALRAGVGCSIMQENTCIRSDRYGRQTENECG